MKIARIGISFIRTFKDNIKQNTLFRSKEMIELLEAEGYTLIYVN